MPYTPSPDASANTLLFQGWLDGLENWDLQRILDPCDETLEHRILPASLGRPQMSKKGYEAYIQSVIPIFESFVVTVHDFTETKDKIIIHVSSVGRSNLGTPYTNEYIVYFDFCESTTGEGGRKICRITEFVDSAYSKDWFAQERARMAEQAAGNV